MVFLKVFTLKHSHSFSETFISMEFNFNFILICLQWKRFKSLDVLSKLTNLEQNLPTKFNENFLNWYSRKTRILIFTLTRVCFWYSLLGEILCSCLHLQLFSFTSRWHQQLKEQKPADTSVTDRVEPLLKREKPW